MSIYIFQNIPTYHSNSIIQVLWALSMIILLGTLSKYLNIKVLNFYGKHSFFIYVFHIYTNNIAHLIAEKMGFSYWFKFFLSLIMLHALLFIKKRFFSMIKLV
ncbi:hypothetical protein [Helicobacter cetorum]|uniref:hypothetical protein n=1 Tax=Helicobacter cetorum TaxID=138563 RepID=UPI0013153AD9|nr:hypothetical protein [Helicobacter cetorum]